MKILKDLLDSGVVDFLSEQNYLTIDDEDVALHLNLFYDKRHSWLEVPIVLLAVLNCRPEDFTKFSYVDKDKSLFYLEEDIDVGLFLGSLASFPDPDNNLLESLHVSPRNHGKLSWVRELEKNSNGSLIH